MLVGTEPRVTYYVGEKTSKGLDVRDLDTGGHEDRARVVPIVEMFNEDEADRARMEQRSVRVEFIVVKASTTFEESGL